MTNANGSLNDAIRYNGMFNQWESMAPMPEAVLHPAVAATNQRIYVFGGEDAMQNPVRIIQVRRCVLQSLRHCLCFLCSSALVRSLTQSVFPSHTPHLPSCRCITLPGTCGPRWRTEQ